MFELDEDLDLDDLFEDSDGEFSVDDDDDLDFDAEFEVDADLDGIDRANSWIEQAHSAGLIDAGDECEIDFE